MATGEEIAGGLMEKAFCTNPECRKTFKIPQGRRGPKPKLCPECREAGIKVGNVAEKPEAKPVEQKAARKPTAKKPAAKRKRPAKPHHTEIEKPAPAIPTQEEIEAECICDHCENSDEGVCAIDGEPLTGAVTECITYKLADPRPAPEDYRPPIDTLPVGPDACHAPDEPFPMTAYQLNEVCRMVQSMTQPAMNGFVIGYIAGRRAA